MIQSGLTKIWPHRKDSSLLDTFGGTTSGLPDNFSIYNGEVIPNQNEQDPRFTPPLSPMPYGCTGETTAFMCGLEDASLYDPFYTYMRTTPYTNGGRNIRDALECAIDLGLQRYDKVTGFNRRAYYNVYGTGPIDDFDAARIALWIFQNEKRGVSVGSWWYQEFERPVNGILPMPSLNTGLASLHNHLVTGWVTINGVLYLEDISWQGMDYGNKGICYISRELFNALMAQPYTAAYTITKTPSNNPVPLGMQVWLDHLIYYLKQLFRV